MKTYLILLCIILGSNTEGYTQNRFRATAILGTNFAQIDGDLQSGYRKTGISVGLSGSVIFKPNFDISFEGFYNQRGAVPDSEGSIQISGYRSNIDLKYADVITSLNFHAFPHRSKQYYIQTIKIGFSYGRLLKSDIDMLYNNIPFLSFSQEILNGLKKDDVSLVAGIAWQLHPQFGIMIRHTNSLSRIYNNYKPTTMLPTNTGLLRPKYITYLKPYSFGVSAFFHFISPHKTLRISKKSEDYKKTKKTNTAD